MISIEKLTKTEDIGALISVVKKYFKTTEKPHYLDAEFKIAEKNLFEFKELNEAVLTKLITTKTAQGFILKDNNMVVGGAIIEVRSGRILFMVSLSNDKNEYKLLTDKMVETVSENGATNSLKILAFIGQSDILDLVGYKYLSKEIYYNYGVKVRALVYSFSQLNYEL